MQYSEKEQAYFRILVAYSQSRSHEQKKIFGKKLIDLLKVDVDHKEIENHYDFLSSPLLPKLQVLLTFEDILRKPESLSRLLNEEPKKVEEALFKLQQINVAECIENPEQEPFWVSKDKFVKVSDKFGDAALEAYHTTSLKEAIKAQKLSTQCRRFSKPAAPFR